MASSDNTSGPDRHDCLMVIEDDSTVRTMLHIGLKRRHNVFCFSNGEETLRLLDSHNPRLLILDVSLPGAAGAVLCDNIRAAAAARRIPILYMTIDCEQQGFLAGLRAEGNRVITKPFLMPTLQKMIDEMLAAAA